jgi:hypothetical protein
MAISIEAVSTKNGYVGAEKCISCHREIFSEWKGSGHANILRKASSEAIKNIPIPRGYNRNDVSYVIGGYRWKALFLDKKGYLITSSPEGTDKIQYNLRSKKWADYFIGQKIFYDCGGCHTTGFSPEGHQNGLKGIIGTWEFEGVQCEVCHGPGLKHSRTSLKKDITIDENICRKCHGKEPFDIILLSGVFLAQYTETNQLLKSKMKNFSCSVCHNPHLSSEKSIKQPCETCHQKTAVEYEESYMYSLGVRCIDCHMPPAGMIAEGDTMKFQGDFKSHLFRIDHRKVFPVVEINGEKTNPGYLSVEYACMPCHYKNRNREWAASFGMFSHTVKVTSNIKIMRLQRVTIYLGFLIVILALLTGLYLKNYIFTSLQLNKKKVLTYHRLFSWTAFSIFVFNIILCTYIHFPLEQPAKALDYGWFLIHPINGVIGAFIYGGKIIAVRKFRKGWSMQGLLWGIGIFISWLIQFGTILFKS